MKYGVVMPTCYNSKIFQESLLSLKESFDGQIVVIEEATTPIELCRDFVESLDVTYLKSNSWGGPDPLVDMGIRVLIDCDIIIYSHNDVIFNEYWFDELQMAWETAYYTNKIGMLNLSFVQPHSNHELIIEEPFLFDFCPDIHQPHRVGRCSVTTSFRRDIFDDGLRLDIGTHLDTELCWNFTKKGQWSCWIRNTPITHMSNHIHGGNDITLTVQHHTVGNYHRVFLAQQERWLKKYGFDLDYYIEYEFLEVKYNRWSEIVMALNSLDFDSIDPLLQGIRTEMLEAWPIHRKTLKND